jgi:hypothetical protein
MWARKNSLRRFWYDFDFSENSNIGLSSVLPLDEIERTMKTGV